MIAKIRIGDTFERTYTRYAPLVSNPSLPAYDTPINLTGLTVKFIIVQGATKTVYTSPLSLTITPLLGRVKVHLSPAQTGLLRPFRPDSTSYLEFTDALGKIESKFQLTEEITTQEDV